MSAENTPQLHYWAIRGLAQPIRTLLKYAKIEFSDVRYTQGGPPDFSREEWNAVKRSNALKLDFPNLPAFVDGNLRLTQSNAILRYIARKAGDSMLYGSNDEEKAIIDMLADQVYDLRCAITGRAYQRKERFESEDATAAFVKKVTRHLDGFASFLGDKKWLAGDRLSFVDFAFHEQVHQARRMLGEEVFDAKYPTLVAYKQAFEQLPAVAEYMASSEYIVAPCNNKTATFCNGM